MNLFIIALFGASLFNFSYAQGQGNCPPLTAPRYASMMCTDGFEARSRCRYTCDEDYQLSETSEENRRCNCLNGVCSWDGPEPVCEYRSPTQASCSVPSFLGISYGVVDTWPQGAVVRVSINPSDIVTRGWSFALMFRVPLPEGFSIEAGNVEWAATSEDRRILTFNSMPHNRNIAGLQVYSTLIVIKDIPAKYDPGNYAALAGFYEKIIEDASCIQVISPVRPLPTTTTTTTQSTTTPFTTTRSSTTRRPRPATTPRQTTTRRTTTTTKATTTTTTTTTRAPTTTTERGSIPSNCQYLNGDEKPGYILLNSGWGEGDNTWKFTGRFEFYDADNVNNWVFRVEFPVKVRAISIFSAKALGPFQKGRVWYIIPESWNQQASGDLKLNFIGEMGRKNDPKSGPDSGSVLFCQSVLNPEEFLSGIYIPSISIAAPPTTTTLSTTTTTTAEATRPPATASPQFLENCVSTDESAFGRLPERSRQTNPSLSTRDSKYSKVLHLSVLFYEAQRSGKLPSSSPIPWRGDAGLKDGCDVSHDLTGGFYDAGDNVKFGFPMAYTMTMMAWGMIEFKSAYVNSNDWSASLDLLKWGTDYLLKAHTAKYELYVQVADGNVDHSKWLRPEDVDYVPKSFKIDINNPGSEVAAETAAAMAAASIVFRPINSDYADKLIEHAEELNYFARKFRGNYHDSVENVRDFYKSWSGYNDELIWASAWLYKATNNQTHLQKAEGSYRRLGGGNTPSEFSWDNKFAGAQILLAQITGNSKYLNAVKNTYRAIRNIPTTPRGLTWRSQWGSNRYAANFAFITIMAAKTLELGNEESDFVAYTRSQIDYLLGNNEEGISYVIGYGNDYPMKPHHRASSCPSWESTPVAPCSFNALNDLRPNPHILYGALVGGPNIKGEYEDDRKDYVKNEVAIDYNAGFQGAVAGLLDYTLTASRSG